MSRTDYTHNSDTVSKMLQDKTCKAVSAVRNSVSKARLVTRVKSFSCL